MPPHSPHLTTHLPTQKAAEAKATEAKKAGTAK
jgi:hypothetical protein